MALIILIGLCACSEKCESLTISALTEQLDNTNFDKQQVIVGDNKYYEDTQVLSELLNLNQWQECSKQEQTTLILKIHLSELYEINIYENYAHVYYGYATIGEDEDAYYILPENTNQNIQTYLESLAFE